MNINRVAERFEDFKAGFYKHSYMQITDNTEIVIDRCKKIIAYDENIIRLQLAAGSLSIVGRDMIMRNFSTDGVIIKGRIHSLEYGE